MKQNLCSGVAMATIGLLFVFVLIPYGVVEPKKVKYAALSPSYYPRFVAIALVLLGVAVTLRSLILKPPVSQNEDVAHPQAFKRILIMFVILGLFAVSIPWLGFIVSSTLVLLSTFYLAGERRFLLIIGLAVVLPLALYFFFLKVASVPIPLGILSPVLSGF
ncbi:MAG: tripartite tricarboxylate transporter TctB family protein [Granulosicoccus sp.]|nr:tripartite tricarboxylate transporter TctB family protein [Granulosicoccus sp.]